MRARAKEASKGECGATTVWSGTLARISVRLHAHPVLLHFKIKRAGPAYCAATNEGSISIVERLLKSSKVEVIMLFASS